jgi:hypothetical protein
MHLRSKNSKIRRLNRKNISLLDERSRRANITKNLMVKNSELKRLNALLIRELTVIKHNDFIFKGY